jgi:Flp pilus assembly protein TadB
VLTWLLVGLGVLAWPARRAAAASLPPRIEPRSLRARPLQLIAAGACVGAAVAACGPGAGVAVGCCAAPLAWFVVGRLHARRSDDVDPALPLALDLAAAALRAGLPVSAAVLLAAPAAGDAGAGRLTRTGRLLALGADPADAWRALGDGPGFDLVAAAGRRSADSGIRLAAALEQAATDLRTARRAAAQARAHRAGAFAVAPLGLCFLPAFVCLGVVPVIVGIARSLPVSTW